WVHWRGGGFSPRGAHRRGHHSRPALVPHGYRSLLRWRADAPRLAGNPGRWFCAVGLTLVLEPHVCRATCLAPAHVRPRRAKRERNPARRRFETEIPAVIDELSRRSGVATLEWRCLD